MLEMPTASPLWWSPPAEPTWEGTGDWTLQSFLMAAYKSSRLPEMMHRSSCTLSCGETRHGEGDAPAPGAGAPEKPSQPSPSDAWCLFD